MRKKNRKEKTFAQTTVCCVAVAAQGCGSYSQCDTFFHTKPYTGYPLVLESP